jgi:RHS repeat-associated protein
VLGIGLCLVIVFRAGAVDAPSDHFVAYTAKKTKKTPKFAPIQRVDLADPIQSLSVDVTAAASLLAPVHANGDGPADPATHLRAYKIRPSKGVKSAPKRPGIAVSNALGTLVVDAVKPVLLLVPTSTDPSVEPPPPNAALHDVDHYTCYAAKLAKGTKLPKGLQLTVTDPFDAAQKILQLTALKHLCLAVNKRGEGVKHAAAALACYAAKPAKNQPKHAPQLALHLNDQFGPLTIDTKKETAVCVPSSATLPGPGGSTPTTVPTGAGVPTPTATGGGVPTATSTAPPPDPSTLAPQVAFGVPSLVADTTSFLYSGPNAIQTGVAAGTIERQRAAVVRGRVVAADGSPLPGVRIAVRAHPEFGQTLSRLDGWFDLAVNGGGALTIDYAKPGLLPAQRQVTVPWQDFVTAPEVMLIALDPNATPVDLASNDPMQVARGSVVTDADGTRQSTLLFPQGTIAEMVMPNGGALALGALTIRATEYTIGPDGPKAMPGDLPASTGYTYAVELSADEAMAAGATEVRFNQPIINYVENYLGFATGTWIPTGYYDRARGLWVASDSGRVIEILSATAGAADVDGDGDGIAETAETLAERGITDAERQRLATLYAPGQTLWRVPIPHLTPWDHNHPYFPPPDACAPGGAPCNDPPPGPEDTPPPEKDRCQRSGASTIDCQRRALGESLRVTGTPFGLHYKSDRAAGNRSPRRAKIRVTPATLPPSLKRVLLEISVAGRKFELAFGAVPNVVHTFEWDGKDVYGRTLDGEQFVSIRIGYEYDAAYYATYEAAAEAYARFGSVPVARTTADSTGNGGSAITLNEVFRGSLKYVIWRDYRAIVGNLDARSHGLGGWSLGVHHVYDPIGRVVHLGNGDRRDANNVSTQITRFAGGNFGPFTEFIPVGDGGPASKAGVNFSNGIAIAPDGTVYFTESGISPGVIDANAPSRIRRVGPDGIITTIAGGGFLSDGAAEGLPATQASLGFPAGIALGPDGTVYFAEAAYHRVRRIRADGVLETVAGTGVAGMGGDTGPANEAKLNHPYGIAFGADGSLYIADSDNRRVRRVSPDGIITTIAGDGRYLYQGDGGQATAASFRHPTDVAIAPDGSIVIGDTDTEVVRRVAPDGIVTRIAGKPNETCAPTAVCGDNGPATEAVFNFLSRAGISFGDGGMYVADEFHHRIRFVDAAGMVRTVVGSGNGCNTLGVACGDDGPARAANLARPVAMASHPDGSLYVCDHLNYRVRKVAATLPGLSVLDVVIPSPDGSELYVFDRTGRHLRTLHGLTGATLYEFGYDGAQRLVTVTDGSGEVTTIERSAGGSPTAIVAPGGQRTNLTVDADGYLTQVANPLNATTQLTYATGTAAGLLTTLVDRRGETHEYTYDADGFLTRDEDPAGGAIEIGASEAGTTRTTTLTTPLGRTTSYFFDVRPQESEHQIVTFPDGTQNEVLTAASGKRTLTSRDGLAVESTIGPDPRFDLQVPITSSLKVTTPAQLVGTTTYTRTANLQSADPFSFFTQVETTTINGNAYTRVYSKGNRTFTTTTPVGRTFTTKLDAQGRTIELGLAGLAPVQATYDTHGKLASLTQGARTYAFAYDDARRLTQVTDPLGQTLQIASDAADRPVTLTRPDAQTVTLAYDAADAVTAVTPPSRGGATFTYTAVGLPSSATVPAAAGAPAATQATYDLDRAVTQISRGGVTASTTYDAAGRVQTLTHAAETRTASYDGSGRIAGITATPAVPANAVSLTYGYDGPLLTDTTWSGAVAGTVHRTHDASFRVDSRTINGGNTQSFVYDADGLLAQAGALTVTRNGGNGLLTGTTLGTVSDLRAFDETGAPTSYQATVGGTEVFAATYTRDLIGRVVAKSETVQGVTTNLAYSYDPVGRLTGVTVGGAPSGSYTYDGNGNRLTGPGVATPATYDAQDRLTQYGDTSYAYDATGALATKNVAGDVTAYGYDVLGNLRTVTLPGGTAIEYLVDGRNRRVGKKINGTKTRGYLYQDRSRVIAELDGSDAIVSTFVYGTRTNVPDFMVKNGTTYRLIVDDLGSPRLVVDTATGAVAQRLAYDELGNVIQDTSPGFQPFGFAGGLYDTQTGLVRFGARDYDAEIGRWTSRDPSGLRSGPNVYAYADGDPVNVVDPNGRNGTLAIALGGGSIEAGAAIGGAFAFGGFIAGGLFIAGGIYAITEAVPNLADNLQQTVEENADPSHDDEGTEEGGVPPTLCPGDADAGPPPTLPAPQNPDAPTLPAPNREAETWPVPRNPDAPTEPAGRNDDTLPAGPGGGNGVYDLPIPKAPRLPTF